MNHNDYTHEDLALPICEYIHGKDKQRVGVFIAGLNPENPGNVVVGFSLCKRTEDEWDRYDYPNGIKTPDFGKNLAARRALKWADHRYATSNMISKSEQPQGRHAYNDALVRIPVSITDKFEKFLRRVRRYYRNREFPVWVVHWETNRLPRFEEKVA